MTVSMGNGVHLGNLVTSTNDQVTREVEFSSFNYISSGAARQKYPTAIASEPIGAVTTLVRATPFGGWAAAYLCDPVMVFDTITIAELKRDPATIVAQQWSFIVLDIADASVETSAAVIPASTEVIATATIAVDPTANTLSNLTFPLVDGLGRPIVLGPHNLPSRFVIRYRAYAADGTTPAVVGESYPSTPSPYSVGDASYQLPTLYTAGQYATWYYEIGSGWQLSISKPSIAFTLLLTSNSIEPPQRLAEGAQFLRNWRSALARIQDGQTVQADIMLLGDSWFNGNTRFAKPIYNAMRAKYGDAGPGFLGFTIAYPAGPLAGGADDAVASVTRTVTGTTDYAGVTALGTDAYSCTSLVAGDQWVITLGTTGYARRMDVHFYRKTAGGTFRWKVAAGSWTTVSTAGTPGMVCQEIDFGSEINNTTITIETETPNTDGVTFHGVNLRRDVAGVRVQKFGRSGGTAGEFAGISEAITLTEVGSIKPDLIAFCFTTNEIFGNISPTTMCAHIETMIRRCKRAAPYADVLIISPFDNSGETKTYKWSEYEDALLGLARKHKTAFFPTQCLIGTWGDANKRGMVADAVPHPTAAGGYLLSGVLIRDFLTLGI